MFNKPYLHIRSVYIAAILGCLVVTAGCGGDGDDDQDDTDDTINVTRVDFENGAISNGEQSVVSVDFSYDAEEVFEDGVHAMIVVKLPPQLQYLPESSEIDGIGTDEGVGAQVTTCSTTGETYLLYDLDENDLDLAENPDGDADARLTLTVTAVAPGNATIVARGDLTGLFACDVSFAADAGGSITIL
jgi:hypothetical protein